MKAYPGLLVLAAWLLLGVSGCAKTGATVEQQALSDYESRRARIVDFFAERQGRYEVVATTKTRSGQIIDWIKPESQVPDGQRRLRQPALAQIRLLPQHAVHVVADPGLVVELGLDFNYGCRMLQCRRPVLQFRS